eukprot:gene150-153_t
MSFFAGFFGQAAAPKPEKFSLAHLQALYRQLQGLWLERDVEKCRHEIVENIRQTTEILIYGEKTKDAAFFDFFCEKNLLADFVRILGLGKVVPAKVKLQLLQTLAILISNIREDCNLYYLFSNNYLNQLILTELDWDDEEILGYYISFLKSLCLQLNTETVKFFFNYRNSFPLYTQAIRFFAHPDAMIRTSVGTMTLAIFKIEDPVLRGWLLRNRHSRLYWIYFACHLRNLFLQLDHALLQMRGCSAALAAPGSPEKSGDDGGPVGPFRREEHSDADAGDADAGRGVSCRPGASPGASPGSGQGSDRGDATRSAARRAARGLLDQIDDAILYVKDVFGCGVEGINRCFAWHLLQYWAFPLVFGSLLQVRQSLPEASWTGSSSRTGDQSEAFSRDQSGAFSSAASSPSDASFAAPPTGPTGSSSKDSLAQALTERREFARRITRRDVVSGVVRPAINPRVGLYLLNRILSEFSSSHLVSTGESSPSSSSAKGGGGGGGGEQGAVFGESSVETSSKDCDVSVAPSGTFGSSSPYLLLCYPLLKTLFRPKLAPELVQFCSGRALPLGWGCSGKSVSGRFWEELRIHRDRSLPEMAPSPTGNAPGGRLGGPLGDGSGAAGGGAVGGAENLAASSSSGSPSSPAASSSPCASSSSPSVELRGTQAGPRRAEDEEIAIVWGVVGGLGSRGTQRGRQRGSEREMQSSDAADGAE